MFGNVKLITILYMERENEEKGVTWMNKPVLVIMAAGMGSRYGGLKQIDPIDEYGHIIMDFSVYDAKEAGFEEVIFIIKKENEQDFRDTIGSRIEGQIKVTYVYQDIDNIPQPYQVPEGRIKPWGTGHAILCCKDQIDGPFAVINADDYYGKSAFRQIYDHLAAAGEESPYPFAMVGYLLKNTITEHGSVSRGVCAVDQQGYLTEVTERTHIEKLEGRILYLEEDGGHYYPLSDDAVVSMNLWGFTKAMMKELEQGFETFLNQELANNPLKGEYFIPSAVSKLLHEEKATVKVLTSFDKWHGVTYQEDKPMVVAAVRDLRAAGLYPEKLWN